MRDMHQPQQGIECQCEQCREARGEIMSGPLFSCSTHETEWTHVDGRDPGCLECIRDEEYERGPDDRTHREKCADGDHEAYSQLQVRIGISNTSTGENPLGQAVYEANDIEILVSSEDFRDVALQLTLCRHCRAVYVPK